MDQLSARSYLRPVGSALVALALLLTALSPAGAEVAYEPQIMNGEAASIEDVPSVVHVAAGDGECTGSLIAPTWVLTAAHCFGSEADEVTVSIGGDTLDGFAEAIAGARIIIHEAYDDTTLHADIALVELATASSNVVQALAPAGFADPVGVRAIITGWGLLDDVASITPTVLQRADVPVLADADCTAVYGSEYDGTTFVCAGGEGKDVCPGDSGGPLLIDRSGVQTQIGVVSYGEECTPLSETHGAFTAVSSYRAWIDGHAGTGADADPEPEPEPEPRFSDVPSDGSHASNIEILVDEGITKGYEDGTYRPTRTVSRAQMATFLAKALGIDLTTVDTSDTGFSDVPSDHPHAAGIVAVADLEITGGYADGTFRPAAPVRRAQMGTFLAKALGVDLESVDTTDTGFPDVPSDHAHAPGIVTIADREITGGYSDGTYGPTIAVNRAQMATFLVTAFELGG